MSKFQAVRLQKKWSRLLKLLIAWLLIAFLESIYLHGIAADGILVIKSPNYDFSRLLFGNLFAALAGGLFSGGLLIFYLRDQFRRYPFYFAVMVNTFIIGLVNIFINSIGFSLYQYWAVSNQEYLLWPSLRDFLNSYFFLKNMVFWYGVSLLTIVTLRVSDKYGPGTFSKVLFGDYHHPSQEERIFMFMDIRSSTTIAEKIGHIKYFNLLNDFFHDITNPVLYTRGEVYQYVGDEVIISWEMKNGIRKANCLRAFHFAQEQIQSRAAYYQRKYGIVPEFKAGLHCGMVTTGEIGLIKKDIVFSGDVLNTTSRIQSKCNHYGVNIILSEYLLKRLQLPKNTYHPKLLGEFALRGKKEKVVLYTV